MISKFKHNRLLNQISLNFGRYCNKIIVIKYGGAAMNDYSLSRSFCDDVLSLKTAGIKMVIVHGGGNEVSAMSSRLNLPVRFVNGLRYTDKATMEVVQMVLVGLTNKNIVSKLNQNGINAIGLCGIDGELFKVKKYSTNRDDLGYVGKINKVNTGFIHDLLSKNYTPVIAPIGTNTKNEPHNINADDAASRIASELKAEKLIYISDVEGIKVNGNILSKIDIRTAKDLIKKKIITNGMIPKIKSAFDSLNSGVKSVHLIDGTSPHSLLDIFIGRGKGTEISGIKKEIHKANLYNQIKKAS